MTVDPGPKAFTLAFDFDEADKVRLIHAFDAISEGEAGGDASLRAVVLSGAGARGLMVDVMTTYGVDSFQGKLAAIIQGSTETTFYVLAVYFGSVNISKTRYAVACGLIADAAGLVGAITIGYLFYH